MYSIIPCKKINDNFYDIKLDLSNKDNNIKKFNLQNKGLNKIYYKNNICIESNNKNIKYFKKVDLNINYKNNYLYSEFNIEEINSFPFYETDYEEEYILFENTIDDVKIQLKEYKNYCELEFITNNLKKCNKLI